MPKAIQKNYLANSAARSELLIVLDYMISNCTDEKTALMQSDVIKYGHDQYNVDIRRDRIPVICQHLLEIQEKYPNKLPFVIEEKKMKANVKYYISKCIVSDDDAVAIVRAINEDPRISEGDTERITDEFLDKGFGEKRKADIKNRAKANVVKNQVARKNEKLAEKYKEFENLQYSGALVTFQICSVYKAKTMDPSFKAYLKEHEGKEMQGIIYQLVTKADKKHDVVVYMPSQKTVFIHNINCIFPIFSTPLKKKALEIEDDKYQDIQQWIHDYYHGLVGEQIEFKFKFVKTLPHLAYVSKRYRDFFGKPLEYFTKTREALSNVANGPVTVKVEDCYGKVKCNLASFRKWYMDYDIMKCVVILSPANANNVLLEEFNNRLTRRIKKYGISVSEVGGDSGAGNVAESNSVTANTTPRE